MGKTVQVTLRAVIQRINRKLAPDLQALKTARSERVRLEIGTHYVIDYQGNFVLEKDVDPETFGRELGVLQPWETVIES